MELEVILSIIVSTMAITLVIVFGAERLRKPKYDGELQIDTNGVKDIYRFVIDDTVLDSLSTKKHILLKVENNVNLQSEIKEENSYGRET